MIAIKIRGRVSTHLDFNLISSELFDSILIVNQTLILARMLPLQRTDDEGSIGRKGESTLGLLWRQYLPCLMIRAIDLHPLIGKLTPLSLQIASTLELQSGPGRSPDGDGLDELLSP